MLSTVSNSDRAIEVNIGIMRACIQMRQLLTETTDLKLTVDALRSEYDEKFEIVFKAFNKILALPIGFIWSKDDK